MIESYGLKNVEHSQGLLLNRQNTDMNYLMSLKTRNLLLSYYNEAGLFHKWGSEEDIHGGWEAIHSSIRGHFTGHYLSAISKMYSSTKDPELKGRIEKIVSELSKCQQENGGKWIGSIPEKYFIWLKEGKHVGVPHYTVHKIIQGLVDSYVYAKIDLALDILNNYADWFIEYTRNISREDMNKILERETGGMLEAWAHLYSITGLDKYLNLIEKYTRYPLFDQLIDNKDVITNMHANTTIPEAVGMAVAYKATNKQYYLDGAMAYWDFAVNQRPSFVTGGQSSGEIWTPIDEIQPRLGTKTQEHCCVFNMCKLAGLLFEFTGDADYADYIEKNIYNGMIAQQNPNTGTPTYFLKLGVGVKKEWGSKTNDFWCCHGSMVEAHSSIQNYFYYHNNDIVYVNQYFSSILSDKEITLTQSIDSQTGHISDVINYDSGEQSKPFSLKTKFIIESNKTKEIKFRIPKWFNGELLVTLNGKPVDSKNISSDWITLKQKWNKDTVIITFPFTLTMENLTDAPNYYAFKLGPIVLAGITDKEITLNMNSSNVRSLFRPYDTRHWGVWNNEFYTVNQSENIKFKPLYEILDETYTVYFPVNIKNKKEDLYKNPINQALEKML